MSVLPTAWQDLPVAEGPSTRRYIGSGDIAAIVAHYRPDLAHLAKWKNASDVWLRILHGLDLPRKRAFDRGLREENPLRQTYRETVGPVGDLPGLIMHPRFPFAGGSPDGLTPEAVVELKTHSIWAAHQWGPSGSDLVPDKYALQCNWLCGLTARSVAHLLMGFGQDATDENGCDWFAWTETRIYVLPFDHTLFAELEALVERFYVDHVQARRAPDCKPVANRRAFKRLKHGN